MCHRLKNNDDGSFAKMHEAVTAVYADVSEGGLPREGEDRKWPRAPRRTALWGADEEDAEEKQEWEDRVEKEVDAGGEKLLHKTKQQVASVE